jgi:hypothetical protein
MISMALIRTVCAALLLPRALAFSIPIADHIRLETAPLIGGPSWLPVHVKVVVDEVNKFDFVPKDAKAPVTLHKLLSLQPVAGEARAFRVDAGTFYSERASKFCEGYSKDLHLVTNNCWLFAMELVLCMLQDEELSAT